VKPAATVHAPALMTRRETAEYLKVSLSQLDRLPDLRPVRLSERVVRYRRADIDGWLGRLADEAVAAAK
jgi:predicted DNA-binding transcriptional regulator AlpA